jgi:hypothetical protein
MVPPPSLNPVEVCNQITLLIFYYISSRLATLLKVIEDPIQVPHILELLFKFQVHQFLLADIPSFVPDMSYLHVILYSDYLHCFALDTVHTAF